MGNRFTRFLGWLYFVRVGVLTLVLVALLGPIGRGTALLGNVVDVSGYPAWELGVLGFATLMACASAVATINIVNHYGRSRFGLRLFASRRVLRLLTLVLGMAAATALLVTVASASEGVQIGWILVGIFLAVLTIGVIKVAEALLTDPQQTPVPEYYVIPASWLPGVRALRRRPPFAPRLGKLADSILRPIFRASPKGYLGARGQVRPGHVFAVVFATVAFVFYATAGGTGFSDSIDAPWASITYLLMFLTVACWALAGFTFFLDRFRIPLLWPVLLFCISAGQLEHSDHYYRVHEFSDPTPYATPAEVLMDKADAGVRKPVVVAAAGGGIQAAAWTTRVLEGLESEIPQFRQSLALISGVSGGSVGAMFYLQEPCQEDLKSRWSAAAASSLEHVAWGWLKPDVARTLIPLPIGDKTRSRGLALEKSWEQRLCLDDVTLSDWAADTRRGRKPALIFNSTAVESGDPMLFATISSGNGTPRPGAPLAHFSRQYNGDVSVATAARMSATFPYVSPASRPVGLNPPFHLVDGGYYDVYGVMSLLDWVQDGLTDTTASGPKPEGILVIRIRPFSDAATAPETRPRGWFYQIYAPLVGLYNVRGAAQHRNAERLLEAYKQNAEVPIDVIDIVYEPPIREEADRACTEPPLSWRLTPRQTKCIDSTWQVIRANKVKEVRQWLESEVSDAAALSAVTEARHPTTEVPPPAAK